MRRAVVTYQQPSARPQRSLRSPSRLPSGLALRSRIPPCKKVRDKSISQLKCAFYALVSYVRMGRGILIKIPPRFHLYSKHERNEFIKKRNTHFRWNKSSWRSRCKSNTCQVNCYIKICVCTYIYFFYDATYFILLSLLSMYASRNLYFYSLTIAENLSRAYELRYSVFDKKLHFADERVTIHTTSSSARSTRLTVN